MQVESGRVAEAPCNGIPSLWLEDEGAGPRRVRKPRTTT